MLYLVALTMTPPEDLRNIHLLLKATFADDLIGWCRVEKRKASFVLGLHASDQPTAVSQLADGGGTTQKSLSARLPYR